tara:strand:- start:3988 stop:4704 length:717 start_codon:yes stop_codon:yes gene_type:complete
MKLLITQPTFLPWIGYYNLINDADLIVFLDDVQFERRSWQQRNNIITNKGLELISIPIISKGKRKQLIKETKINIKEFNFAKFKKKIIQNYSKSKFFDKYGNEFFNVFNKGINQEYLIKLNFDLIQWTCNILKIKKKFLFSSELNINSKSTLRIIEIAKSLNINDYITTIGATTYLKKDIKIIKKSGLNVLVHNYNHPIYNQCFKPFTEYASIIDLIMNEGEKSLEIIKRGKLPYQKL